MDYTLSERMKNAWNAFNKRGPTYNSNNETAVYYRPDRPRVFNGNERSIVNSIYNRIAVDAASVDIHHVKVNENDQVVEILNTSLDDILTLDANMDQTGRAFIQDIVQSLCSEGSIAVVPIDLETHGDPTGSESLKILTARVGKITQWYPSQVKVEVYNERNGKHQEITMPKHMCAIVENPFYAVMNEPNSTLRRLIHKLNLLDAIDNQSSSGKLDIIIQLPYTIKTEARRIQAETRRKEIETQLVGSKYGIAYTDGTEHITQLNRPVENNLMKQIEYLTAQLYGQLGLTDEIMNGTADDKTMNNYYTRTIEPILSAICEEMERKFLSKTARTQGQSIKFIRDPFKLIPVTQIADIADKFTRNEVLTSNEVRSMVGFKPSDDPEANELRNKNLNKQAQPETQNPQEEIPLDDEFQEPDQY